MESRTRVQAGDYFAECSRMKIFFLMVGMLLAAVAPAAELTAAGQAEIAQLFTHLERSGCQFNRNGRWYGSSEAVAHLKKKFDYLQKKKLLGSAEDFIARGAAESSVSGQPYLVKCGSAAPVQSSSWFRAALEKFRQAPH
jgi:hypothetical protein